MVTVCHFEIRTTDIAATKAFLGGLFGWTFTDFGPEYAVFNPGREPGGGIEQVDSPREEGGVQIYLAVDSIDRTLAKAEELGGETETPRTEIGQNHGYFAKLRVPGGTVIGLWQPSGGQES